MISEQYHKNRQLNSDLSEAKDLIEKYQEEVEILNSDLEKAKDSLNELKYAYESLYSDKEDLFEKLQEIKMQRVSIQRSRLTSRFTSKNTTPILDSKHFTEKEIPIFEEFPTMQIEEPQYSQAQYKVKYTYKPIQYLKKRLDMDDSQFIIKDSSNMRFFSEDYMETTIWIQ